MNNYQQGRASNRINNATAAFMQLREAAIAEAQRDYEQNKYLYSLQLKERQQQAEEARQLLLRSGLDLKHLDNLEATEDRRRHAFLQQVRPPLAERPLALEAHL